MKYLRNFIIIIGSIIIGISLLVISITLSAAGDGINVIAVILFPVTYIISIGFDWGGHHDFLYMIVSLLYYPTYGVLLSFGNKKGLLTKYSLNILITHILAIILVGIISLYRSFG